MLGEEATAEAQDWGIGLVEKVATGKVGACDDEDVA